MKAYKIAIGILIIQFSIPVASAVGFSGLLSGVTSTKGIIAHAASSPVAWIKTALPLLSVGAAAGVLGLRTNLGALVFAGIFTVGSVPLAGTMELLKNTQPPLMLPSVDALITTIITVVFLFAFIQLASSPAKGAY